MQITTLQIHAYGLWRDLRLDGIGPGVTVFWGPNEAGKTTLLQFLRGVLYGFSPRSGPEEDAAFASSVIPGGSSSGGSSSGGSSSGGSSSGGSASAPLLDSEVDRLLGGGLGVLTPQGPMVIGRWVRPGGPVAGELTLVSEETPVPLSDPETLLSEWTGGLDAKTYRSVFALELGELQRLATLEDTAAGELLYQVSAGLGTVSVSHVQQDLRSAQLRIIAPEGQGHSRSELGDLLARRSSLQAQLRKAASATAQYRGRLAEVSQLNQRISQSQQQIQQAESKLQRLDALQAAAVLWPRRLEVTTLLAESNQLPKLPSEGVSRWGELRSLRNRYRQAAEQAEGHIEQLQKQMDNVQTDDPILHHASRVEALGQQNGWVQSTAVRLGSLQVEIEQLQASASRIRNATEQDHAADSRGSSHQRQANEPTQPDLDPPGSVSPRLQTAVDRGALTASGLTLDQLASLAPWAKRLRQARKSYQIAQQAATQARQASAGLQLQLAVALNETSLADHRDVQNELQKISQDGPLRENQESQEVDLANPAEQLDHWSAETSAKDSSGHPLASSGSSGSGSTNGLSAVDLAAAQARLSQEVSLLRQRVSLEQDEQMLQARSAQQARRCQQTVEVQLLPLWLLLVLGGFFVLGVSLLSASLVIPDHVPDWVGWPPAIVGLVGVFAAIGGKYLWELAADRKLHKARQDLAELKAAVHRCQDQQRELEQQLDQRLLQSPLSWQEQLDQAEDERQQLEELAEMEEERIDASVRADRAEREAQEQQRRFRKTLARWRKAAVELGLPEDLTPGAWSRMRQAAVFVQAHQQASLASAPPPSTQPTTPPSTQAVDSLATTEAVLAARQAEASHLLSLLDAFRLDLQGLLSDLGEPLVNKSLMGPTAEANQLAASNSVPAENWSSSLCDLVRDLLARLQSARERSQRRRTLKRKLRAAERRLRTARQQGQTVRRRQAAWLARCGVSHPKDLRQAHQAAQERERLQGELDQLDAQLHLLFAGVCEPSELQHELAGLEDPATSLAARRDQLRAELHDHRESLASERQLLGRCQAELQALAADRASVRLRAELAEIDSRLLQARFRWQAAAAAELAVSAVREQFERDRQPETLTRAGEYLRHLSDGRYGKIWTPLDRNELLVENESGLTRTPAQLSRGTREQLFLALRLAVIDWYASRNIRLPIVFDDLLVNFDARRTTLAAELLTRFASDGSHQVLVFTCHEHLGEVFEAAGADVRALPNNTATSHTATSHTATSHTATSHTEIGGMLPAPVGLGVGSSGPTRSRSPSDRIESSESSSRTVFSKSEELLKSGTQRRNAPPADPLSSPASDQRLRPAASNGNSAEEPPGGVLQEPQSSPEMNLNRSPVGLRRSSDPPSELRSMSSLLQDLVGVQHIPDRAFQPESEVSSQNHVLEDASEMMLHTSRYRRLLTAHPKQSAPPETPDQVGQPPSIPPDGQPADDSLVVDLPSQGHQPANRLPAGQELTDTLTVGKKPSSAVDRGAGPKRRGSLQPRSPRS